MLVPSKNLVLSIHAFSTREGVLPVRMRFSICSQYATTRSLGGMRVLIVEDEPLLAEAIRDGLRHEAIAADIALDGETALYLLDMNGYDIVVLDRDLPRLSGDEVAKRIVQSGSGLPYGSGHAPLSRRLGLLASLRSRHRDRHHLDLCSQSLGPAESFRSTDPHRSHRTSGRRSPGRVVARRQDIVTACTNHRGDTRRRYRRSISPDPHG